MSPGPRVDPNPLTAGDLPGDRPCPAGTFYATVHCFDGEDLAIAFTEFEVLST